LVDKGDFLRGDEFHLDLVLKGEQIFQQLLAVGHGVGPGAHRAVPFHEGDASAVSSVYSVLLDVSLVPQAVSKRRQPGEFGHVVNRFFAGDHLVQGFVFGHHRAGPAAKPAPSAGLLGRVMNHRTFATRRISVEHRKVLIDVLKGIGHAVGPIGLQEVRPDIVGAPVLDGSDGAGGGNGTVGVQVGIHPGVGVHRGFASGGFVKAGAQQKVDDGRVAEDFSSLFNEALGWPDFHAVRAPSEFSNRRWIPSADEVAPEGLFVFGDQFNYFDRQTSVFDVEAKALDEFVNVVDDRWSLNQGVDAGDVHSFAISNRWRELLHGLEQMHRQGGAVLASGEAKHPRDVARVLVQRRQIDHRSSLVTTVDNLFQSQRWFDQSVECENSMAAGGWTQWTDDLVDVLIAMNLVEGSSFTLQQVYMYENLLRKLHPTNQHIKAKIRQQLQILRDFGVVKFENLRGNYTLVSMPR